MKKSLVSVILVASMMLSIGGCGLKKKNDSKILEGNWKADLECEKIVTDELSKDEDAKSNNMAMIDAIKKYADFNELEALVTFKFNQDSTYSIEPDLEQWNSTWGAFSTAALNGAREYYKSIGVGDAMVEGFESKEEFLGYSIAYTLMDLRIPITKAVFVQQNGKYKAINGKLYINKDSSKDVDITTDYYGTYEITGDSELTVKNRDGVEYICQKE